MSNHDELMSNFFAQPDALAYGKVNNKWLDRLWVACAYHQLFCFAYWNAYLQTPEQLHSEKVPENLIPHKVI